MPGVQSASYPVFFKGILMRDNKDFTTGRILSPLIRFMIPVFFAMLLQAMYGAVDLIIVGKFGHSSDVSAVSTGSQMMMTITNLVTSFAMGTTMIDWFPTGLFLHHRRQSKLCPQRIVSLSFFLFHRLLGIVHRMVDHVSILEHLVHS